MQLLALLLALLCCFVSFLGGFLYAEIKNVGVKEKKTPELTEIEKRKLEREKKEYNNFMNYIGDEQG